MMKALVKSRAGPGLWMEEVPVPEPGPGEVRVKILKTAICGTDLHIHNWDDWAKRTIKVPMVIGHEFAGRVDSLGEGVRGFAEGDVVSGEGHIVCGHCRNCMAGRRHLCKDTRGVGVDRPGAFAEYLCIPASNVWYAGTFDKLSARVLSASKGAGGSVPVEVLAFFDPLGNAAHTALSFDLVGEDVLITGAGPIGLMSAAIARHVGARHVVVTDVNPYRLELAGKMGATLALDVRERKIQDAQRELGMREGFDVGFEMSGNAEAFRDMIANMRHGGSIALLGILPREAAIDWQEVIFGSLVIKGVYGREMFETWYKMTAMLESGLDVRPVLTHRLAVEDFREGFEVMRSGECGKVVLDWP